MKNIVRILTLTLVLAGTYSVAFSTPQTSNKASFGGNGDPVPLCDPMDPTCTINGNN